MATQVTNYKCPACTGPLHFVGESGQLECDYCGSKFVVAEIEALYAKQEEQAGQAFTEAQEQEAEQQQEALEWDESGLTDDWGADGEHMRAYNCPSCGAELICDDTTAATSCPYCGNPSIVPGQFQGALKPDYVIPFKLSKEQAVAALKDHYRGKKLLPNTFLNENHVQEIKGVYVPFWLYDGEADADLTYKAVRSTVVVTNRERITTMETFDVRRAGTVPFEKIPVDASNKMPDDYMDAIEPYDYSELKPFSTAYLPGYLADKYDVSSDDGKSRAQTRVENTVLNAFSSTVGGYNTVSPKAKHISLNQGTIHYALFPVWLLTTRYEEKNYLFAMNGQTGKMVSDLPISKKKYWGYLAGITAGLTAVFGLLLTMLLG